MASVFKFICAVYIYIADTQLVWLINRLKLVNVNRVDVDIEG